MRSARLVKKANRARARAPKRTQGWCACDMAIVAPGKKCPACGRKEKPQREKRGHLDDTISY